jgi:Asp-tRNA(Asn)/Glu-tRNA(Gln) amidotransferase A subunit family amidase
MTTSGTSTYDPENYRLRTFYDASAEFRDGRDTPRAYLERCLETIEEKEPLVRAWVVLNTENAASLACVNPGARDTNERGKATWFG